ncbi:MAG TPA: hypothetical protein VM580_26130, partial [Labilithrix sp.]|nr:hypothetical protein [Labilithrix sp.]
GVGGAPVTGIFVSASKGNDLADGAKHRPLKTLAAAIARAKEQAVDAQRKVIACAETFDEAVVLVDGVSMFGNYDCGDLSDWKEVATHATIASPTSPAVVAENLTVGMRFEGFDVVAPDQLGTPQAKVPAASSYAMIVKGTEGLVLSKTTLRAGKGQDGRDGDEPAEGNKELSTSVKGGDAGEQVICSNTGVFTVFGCMPSLTGAPEPLFVRGKSGGVSSCRTGPNGGPGGTGGQGPIVSGGEYRSAYTPAAGLPEPGSAPTALTAPGGAPNGLGSEPGKNGREGDPGTKGANGRWSFDASGFVPVDGSAGSMGGPGQGGGGGAGTTQLWKLTNTLPHKLLPYSSDELPTGKALGATGAGGGAGGCGGLPGTAGTTGGASVGLFVVASKVMLESGVRIEAKAGGRAGKGTLGTVGTPGNAGGAGRTNLFDDLKGAAGGAGGAGGAAGLSGHGAPGPSIAMVFSGTRPDTSAGGVELIAGTPGQGAPALVRGNQSLPAVVGVAKAEQEF